MKTPKKQKIPSRALGQGVVATLSLFLPLFLFGAIFFFSESSTLYTKAGSGIVSFAPKFTTTVDLEKKIIHDVPIISQSDEGGISSWLWRIRSPLQEFMSSAPFLFTASLGIEDEYALVRIPPGARREEIAEIFSPLLEWKKEEQKEFLSLLGSFEGRLPSGTYVFKKKEAPQEVLGALSNRFGEKVSSRYTSETEGLVPMETALTLASIVQRESAGNTNDMSLIAGIFWNRLFSEDKLQSDVTLQYAKGSAKRGWWPTVYPKDKYINSPYNTYRNEGLPPAPIASPSVKAIEAVLNPEKTSCYFFLHDRKGEMHCAVTYEEHLKNIKIYY